MSDFFMSTAQRGNYETRIVTIDSKESLLATTSNEPCKFTSYLYEPIVLTAPTEIYLESLWIGGFKINYDNAYHFNDNIKANTIQYFSINVDEFEIDSIAGEYNSPADRISNKAPDVSGFSGADKYNTPAMHGRFNIPNEVPVRATDAVQTMIDTKPFTLGHLSKTAIYVSNIKPKTLTKFNVDIKDQDGLSIFHTIDGGIENPPALSRRIIMQFLLIEDKNL
jgi:hypothetical protein